MGYTQVTRNPIKWLNLRVEGIRISGKVLILRDPSRKGDSHVSLFIGMMSVREREDVCIL